MDLKDKERKEKNISKNKHFIYSLDFAITGLKTAFKDERNFRFHCFALVAVCMLGVVMRLSVIEWIWILLSATLVIVMELVNTSLENLVDMITNYHFHPLGKKVKDMGASIVLVQSIFALIVGLLIFGLKFYDLIFH
ncbi:diacylglycerol kinase family protein [Enterococcus cecorum]